MMIDQCAMCGEPMDAISMTDAGICIRCAEEEELAAAEERDAAMRDYYADMKMDQRRMGEGFTFDRFMDRIVLAEGGDRAGRDKKEDVDPRRSLLERITERPNNRIRYVRK